MIFFRFVLGNSGLDFGEDCGFPLIEGDDFVEFVALFRKEWEVLLINGLDKTDTELVLSGVFKGRIIVHVLFECLAGTHNIIIGQVQENTFELKLFGTGSSQLITQILFSNIFQYLN
jgi:hypothetical protein